MNECELSALKNRAKAKVRIMVKSWIYGNVEMQKTLVKLADWMATGIIDDKTLDLLFQDQLIAHIASNRVEEQHVLFTTILWELIKEVLIEESKAMLN